MSSLQKAIRQSSICLIRNAIQNQGPRSLPSLRQFSTESSPPPSNESAAKPISDSQSPGFLYGKLLGITNNTLKSDVLSLLEECNLTTDDLKVDYTASYLPTGMLVQFSSQSAYDAALRAVTRRGRLYRFERTDRANWDYVESSGGKFVLLQGIPQNANIEDIERFLVGCEYDPSSIRSFFRQGPYGSTRMALVRFNSPTAAMSAMITKNRSFCNNNQISINVLQ